MVTLTALQRKLVRDLNLMRGQVLTIALVVACGIASFVSMRSTHRALLGSQQVYYDRYRFADVFVSMKRAPDPLLLSLLQVDGVAAAYGRVVAEAMLPMPGMAEPATGRLISLPEHGPPPLNDVFLREGRTPDPFRTDEALVLESFARAHGLRPGDPIAAVFNNRRRTFRITGLALSPEYVMPVGGANMMIDNRAFAVLWAPRRALAPLMQMEGAFNDAVLKLQPGASVDAVLGQVDRLVEPYGGLGAVPRARQPSHLMLSGELTQLQGMALVLPLIFLGVAAFLVNVVLSRIVAVQRSQIATLKAVGYTDREVGAHYLALCGVIVTLGTVLGVALGAWLGRAMVGLYTEYFHFPVFVYRLHLDVVASATLVSLGSAFVGALVTVRSVVRLPPAEAMRPPAPAVYHHGGVLASSGVLDLVPVSVRMVLREAGRRPTRLILSAVGVAFAVSILVVGRYMADAMDNLMDTLFHVAQREDLSVSFSSPQPDRAVRSLAHLPGVWRAEPTWAVPVRFHAGAVHRDSALIGHAPGEILRAIVEHPARRVPLPDRGVVLTRKLGEILGARAGDVIEVERLDGAHRRHRVAVAALAEELFGLQGHMQLDALTRLFGEPPTVSGAQLLVEPRRGAVFEVQQRLKDLPVVRGVSRRESAIEQFQAQSGKTMLATTLIMTLFAAAIALGIIYNNARIALEVKSRDLASLRVLGFTKAEIGALLMGELGLQVALAIPLGLLFGKGLTWLVAQGVDAETFRFPVDISPKTYLFATATALVISAGSALLVRRQLGALDLIGVLKTRE